jgi:hypothetical protein
LRSNRLETPQVGYRLAMSEADPPDLQDSTPGSAGKHRAEGGMGVSSERTGYTGSGEHSTDGVRDTSAADDDTPREDLPPEQRPDQDEENPVGLEPKAGYPSLDPRSE